MSKHTQGPWKVSSSTMVIADSGKLMMVCNTLPLLYFDVAEENISIEQASANARLIAEAPAMLDALKKIGVNQVSYSVWDEINKVIARADGKE